MIKRQNLAIFKEVIVIFSDKKVLYSAFCWKHIIRQVIGGGKNILVNTVILIGGLLGRRTWQCNLIKLVLLLLLSLECHARPTSTLPNGVAAGDANSRSVVLWTRSTVAGPIEFRYWRQSSTSSKAKVVYARSDGVVPVKVRIDNLLPGTKYKYRVIDNAHSSISGKFETPHEGSGHFGLRFGVSGDARGDNSPYYSMRNIPRRRLAFVVNLGDTVYADVESPGLPGIDQARTLSEFHAKHAEVYSKKNSINAMSAARASSLFYCVIDDHEVTDDFAGGASPNSDPRFENEENVRYINESQLYRNGLQAFMDFNPIQETTYPEIGDSITDGRPQLYRYQLFAKDAAIFITDSRSFRNQSLVPPTPGDNEDLARFRGQAFQANRSMLGQRQLNQLLTDLTDAENKNVVWKFVIIPEPIQNLTYIAANDRYEGYATERTELLRKIKEKGIHNVVFVAADIHGTVINNLTYQDAFGLPQIQTDAFEITTGSWAYREPLAPTVVQLMKDAGFLSTFQFQLYQSLSNSLKEKFVRRLLDTQLSSEGYDQVGLQNSLIDAELRRGGYTATHSFGWSEFVISAKNQQLSVTTFGVSPESSAAPKIISQFVVKPFRKVMSRF